jgi:hypothetical protein
MKNQEVFEPNFRVLWHCHIYILQQTEDGMSNYAKYAA